MCGVFVRLIVMSVARSGVDPAPSTSLNFVSLDASYCHTVPSTRRTRTEAGPRVLIATCVMHEQRAPAQVPRPAQVVVPPTLQQAAPTAPHEQMPVATVLLSHEKPGWHEVPSQHAWFASPHS